MADIFTSRFDWACSVVGTLPRFWLVAAGLTCALWLALYTAANAQWHAAAWALGFFLTAYQLSLIYVLRRLVLTLKRVAPASTYLV